MVCVGAIVDQLLIYASTTVGISIQFNFIIASIVAVWIICNEIIRILENISDIGVELPPFLLPLVKNIKNRRNPKWKARKNNMAKTDQIRDTKKLN